MISRGVRKFGKVRNCIGQGGLKFGPNFRVWKTRNSAERLEIGRRAIEAMKSHPPGRNSKRGAAKRVHHWRASSEMQTAELTFGVKTAETPSKITLCQPQTQEKLCKGARNIISRRCVAFATLSRAIIHHERNDALPTPRVKRSPSRVCQSICRDGRRPSRWPGRGICSFDSPQCGVAIARICHGHHGDCGSCQTSAG
jgi:hypothetical protein